MAGLHELYGVTSSQELLARIGAPRERRPRRIRVDREAIRQELEKEGVPRWDVERTNEQSAVNTNETAAPLSANPEPENRQEQNEEVSEQMMISVPISYEKESDSDHLNEHAASTPPTNEDEVAESPLPSPHTLITSTPKGYILPVPARRKIGMSPNEAQKESDVAIVQERLMVENMEESSLRTIPSEESGPIRTVQSLAEDSEVLKEAEFPAKGNVVSRKRKNKQQRNKNEEVETEHESNEEVSGEREHSRDNDQEFYLMGIGEKPRQASSITDLDVAMTVVKRVCQDYGSRSTSRSERHAIRLFYRHMKNTCAKTIKELHHFQRLQQALKKLRKERKEMMEQLVSLERRKAKIDNQVTEGQKKLTKLKDKETRAEGCLKFLKELELLRN